MQTVIPNLVRLSIARPLFELELKFCRYQIGRGDAQRVPRR